MATTIFLVLNGVGVIFLLYVLVHFWDEGHLRTKVARKYAAECGQRDWVEVFVATHPITHSAQGGTPVIPFPVRERGFDGESTGRPMSRGASVFTTLQIYIR